MDLKTKDLILYIIEQLPKFGFPVKTELISEQLERIKYHPMPSTSDISAYVEKVMKEK